MGLRRPKSITVIEAEWPCQTPGVRDKSGLEAIFKLRCDCADCRKVYSDIAGYAVNHLATMGREPESKP